MTNPAQTERDVQVRKEWGRGQATHRTGLGRNKQPSLWANTQLPLPACPEELLATPRPLARVTAAGSLGFMSTSTEEPPGVGRGPRACLQGQYQSHPNSMVVGIGPS